MFENEGQEQGSKLLQFLNIYRVNGYMDYYLTFVATPENLVSNLDGMQLKGGHRS